jgi:Caspase domain
MTISGFWRRCRWVILASGLVLGFACGAALAESRTALVVGNANYPFGALANPVNDATDVAAALRKAGFEVALKTNVDSGDLKGAIREFGERLKARGGVGLFYFAGHGVQIKGENFIVPIVKNMGGEDDLKRNSVSASEAVDAMAAAHTALNIVVLDACRTNPFNAGGTKGLSRIDSNARLFVSYSTSPGAEALDGAGRNSPYTKFLSHAIETPALSLEDTFKRTLEGVYRETKGEQTPWISSTFFGNFVFRPANDNTTPAAPPSSSVAAVAPPRSPSHFFNQSRGTPAVTGVYRATGRNPNGSRYHGVAAITPRGDSVRVRWWIGRDVFNGTGDYAGRMLAVNWGAKHPVVYSFAGERLKGEWADGTATEDLTLLSRATDATVVRPHGRYEVRGRNPNGSRYSGSAHIDDRGDRIAVEWRVASKSYRGTGTLDGNVLTVDWGAANPVVYALASDGTLRGLWNGGDGEEVLTPAR